MAVIILLFLSNLINGGDINVKIKSYPKEVILGEPIYVCVGAEYKGDGAIKIAKGERGFKVYARIERVDGKAIKQMRPPSINWAPYHSFEEIRNGWKEEVCKDISELKEIEEGEYYITGEVTSEGPFYERVGNGKEIVEREAWRGKIQSEKVIIRVKYPEGIDREAYEYFKKTRYKEVPLSGEGAKEVLEKFPTSTYAGWVLARTSSGAYFTDYTSGKELIEDMLKPVEKRFRSGVIAKCEGEKYKKLDKRPGECWKTIDYIAQEYIGYAEKFLRAKNEHIYMGEILSRIAMAHIILNNWGEAYGYLSKSIELLKEDGEKNMVGYSRNLKIMEEVKEELKLRGFIKNH